ncbi:hypothetical protein [Streptomyces sp. MUM 203J]|uniref:hypothetical protein n=1 Tax=Streptomyces sp. MUM 203J TaxID=2791990 RepID=UPI001F046D4B|nr:hypothetical protein [Streptomyces sp. MUM 203J]
MALLVLVGLALGLNGCTTPGDPGGAAGRNGDARGIQGALDARAESVLAREVAPDDPAAQELSHLADVPLASWTYRILQVRQEGPRTAEVRAELSYTLEGHGAAGPVSGERALKLWREREGSPWRVHDDRRAEGAAAQLWEQGRVDVVRGARSLVLGVGHRKDRLRELAAVADRAVPAVAEAWTEPWAQGVVVLMPPSVDAMGELLGEPAAGYRGIAAVTTGRTGGHRTGRAVGGGDRVIVNPEAYETLGDYGRRFVLTHETAHVATRAHTSAATPLWLSEGFADWVAHRDSGAPGPARHPTAAPDRRASRGPSPVEAAPELRRAVRAGKVPDALPGDADFTSGGDDTAAVARAYEGGWLACALIADRWGEAKLTAFYQAVGAHEDRGGAMEEAMRTVLSTTPDAFTRLWQDRLRQDLSSADPAR